MSDINLPFADIHIGYFYSNKLDVLQYMNNETLKFSIGL